jgi:hypothetical protein
MEAISIAEVDGVVPELDRRQPQESDRAMGRLVNEYRAWERSRCVLGAYSRAAGWLG